MGFTIWHVAKWKGPSAAERNVRKSWSDEFECDETLQQRLYVIFAIDQAKTTTHCSFRGCGELLPAEAFLLLAFCWKAKTCMPKHLNPEKRPSRAKAWCSRHGRIHGVEDGKTKFERSFSTTNEGSSVIVRSRWSWLQYVEVRWPLWTIAVCLLYGVCYSNAPRSGWSSWSSWNIALCLWLSDITIYFPRILLIFPFKDPMEHTIISQCWIPNGTRLSLMQ